MDAEFDCELKPDQWETLRTLRLPAHARLNRRMVAELVALGLAAFDGSRPFITARGRSVLLRGSPRLLDLAA